MPEGHTIHRAARLQREALSGHTLTVTSPQGRFAAGAAQLDGGRVETVEAVGKHLFYRWADGQILHIHLGLFGKFQTFHGQAAPPTAGTRLALVGAGVTIYLAGATACELIDDEDERRLRARLGPDPLAPDADGAVFAANLARRKIGIGAALLDQAVIAGIGNVYRAELCFLIGLHPDRPAASLRPAEVSALWEATRSCLEAGERAGVIVTVDPADLDPADVDETGDLADERRVYVYRRTGQPCLRCGATVRSWELAGRTISACPKCQPKRPRRTRS